MSEKIKRFLSDWAAAERAGDTETLAKLLADDFCGVGPLGFVLPRPAWLGRHGQGLVYKHFSLEETQVRLYGDVAVVVATNNTRGTYQGQPLPEAARATLVVADSSGRPRLAAIHLSFIAGAKGSPPMPAPTGLATSGAHTQADREEG